MISFSFLDSIEKIKKHIHVISKVLNSFENIMENGAFALGANASVSIIFF